MAPTVALRRPLSDPPLQDASGAQKVWSTISGAMWYLREDFDSEVGQKPFRHILCEGGGPIEERSLRLGRQLCHGDTREDQVCCHGLVHERGGANVSFPGFNPPA